MTDEELLEKVRAPSNHENWREFYGATTKFDDERKGVYLRALDLTGRKGLAAKAADVSMQTVRDHIERVPDFAKAVESVLENRSQRIVERLEQQFIEGHFEPIVNKDGEVIGERKKLETQARIKVVQRHEKEYRDKQEIDLNQTGGVLVVHEQENVEDWVKNARKLRDQMMQKGYIEGDGEDD